MEGVIMIHIENLVKRYGDLVALNHLNLDIHEGEIFGLLGPNGSGKTTAINCLLSLLKYDKGTIEVFGQPMTPESYQVKQQIGIVLQNVAVFDELTVYENVELPLVYLGIKPAVRKEKVKRVLEKVNLLHRASHFPQQLSGGQQQRVAIARAVVTDCKLLLADEPTGNLDSVNGVEVMELLRELNRQGTTIIIVTHSQRDATYAHRIIRLLDGKIVAEDINRPLTETSGPNTESV